jgi:hypothetical protein
MGLTQIAVAALGLYLVYTSQAAVSSTVTLVWGLVVVVLVVWDAARVR